MGQLIEITNLEYSAADLRRLASREGVSVGHSIRVGRLEEES